LILAALARPAAADEREFMLAVEPAFSLIHVGNSTAWGGGGGVDLSYGVSDAIAIRVTGAFTGQAIGDYTTDTTRNPSGTVLSYHAGAGLTYIIDILRVVPFIDFSFGLVGSRRPTPQGDVWQNDFGMEIGIGLDYLINRRIAVGAVVRYHAYLTALSTIPVWLYAGPRIAFHFGG
jgi:hypothetical protein